VFEENTDALRTWADGAASAFGQSATEALNFASGFGTAFKNVGMSLDETTEKSKVLTRLAADLGSAFNASSQEAANALRSGLLGESEPLRRFGVFLDETKTKAKALAMGFVPVKGAFTDTAKVAARYALILEQTADSQGMFGRDSGSLADAQKSLAAEMDNLQAAIGDDLLPVMLELTKFLKNDLVPAVKNTMDAMGHLGWAMDFQKKNTKDLMFWQRGLLGLWTDGQQGAEAYAASVERAAYLVSDAAMEGAGAWDTYSEKAAAAREATKNIGSGVAGAMAPIVASADDARDALRRVTDAFRDVSRAGRDNLLETAYDAKRLPNELVLAEQEVEDAHKERYHSGKKLTRAERAEANLRVINASEEVSKLKRKNADLITDYGKTGTALGEALMLPFSRIVREQAARIDSILRSIGKGIAFRPPATVTDPRLEPGSPFLATGGPVHAGGAYVVGERGPELFMPRQSGTVIPNGGRGGGISVSPVIYITTRPEISVRDVERAARVRASYTQTAGSKL
jgi:hypothetical protein